MPPTAPTPKTPIVALTEALDLVFKGIALAEKGLERNPTKEQERQLNETLNDLELERAAIEAKLSALIAKTRPVAGPTPEQVAEIGELLAQVEAKTNDALTASAAVALTARVLGVATEVAAG